MNCLPGTISANTKNKRSLSTTLLIFLVALSASLPTGHAIITHPDVPDSEYQADVTTAPFFVSLRGRGDCAGAVIALKDIANPKYFYIATAAHCLCARAKKVSQSTVIFSDGSKAQVKSPNIIFNSKCEFKCPEGRNQCDLALLKLPVEDVPETAQKAALSLYEWNDEPGKDIDIYGYGVTGKADDFATMRACNRALNAAAKPRFRRAQNVVASVSTGILNYKMDCTSPPPRPLEGLSSSGDSGGPAIITSNGVAYLAGVNSGSPEQNECDCGTIDQYARVSTHYKTFLLPAMGEDASDPDPICRPGFRYTTKCVKCGAPQFYCVNGAMKKVSPGYYAKGGTWKTRTGQAKCGDNAFYCINGRRKKALSTQYTVGGSDDTTRTGVKTCNTIFRCRVAEICTRWNDQKCEKCKSGYRRVQTQGKPDQCIPLDVGESNSDRCMVTAGFNGDLQNSIPVQGAGWTEIEGWRTWGTHELYNHDAAINTKGRFFPSQDVGYFLCSANIRLDEFSGTTARMMIAINRYRFAQDGISVVEGGRRSTNFFSLTATGTLKLEKGDFVSVMVYTSGDDFYRIHSQSGFSCHQLFTSFGFHAVKEKEQDLGRQWLQVTGWRDSGKKGLYNIDNRFDVGAGVFKASRLGNAAYYCAARIRFDRPETKAKNAKGATIAPSFRVHLRVNGEQDEHNGLHAVEGNGVSSNRYTLGVAGTLNLNAEQQVSVWAYASVDAVINPESGFSCHQLGTHRGFHADLAKDKQYGRGWSTIKGWKTWSNNELYAWKGRPGAADGVYTASATGFYVCTASVQADSMSTTSSKIIIALNRKQNAQGGFFSVEGNGGSTDQRTLRVGGTIALKLGWEVSIRVFTITDKNWVAKSQSGFSCHMLKTFDGCTEQQEAVVMAEMFKVEGYTMDSNGTDSTAPTHTDAPTSPPKHGAGQPTTTAGAGAAGPGGAVVGATTGAGAGAGIVGPGGVVVAVGNGTGTGGAGAGAVGPVAGHDGAYGAVGAGGAGAAGTTAGAATFADTASHTAFASALATAVLVGLGSQ